MDVPPSLDMLSERRNASFISIKEMPAYQPSYHWNDDERDTKDYLQYYEDRDDLRQIWCEHVPVFRILKELYDEEKTTLYRSGSVSSQTESDIYDIVWSNDIDDACFSEDASASEDETVVLPLNEDVLDASVLSIQNKFMYT
jgi:hypothetical protein